MPSSFRYLRARFNQLRRWVGSRTSQRTPVASAGGASAAVIVLTATTRDHPAIQATIAYAMQLPALASPEGVAVGGPGIVKSPSLNMALVAVAAAAVTAAALAFFLTRRRR